MSTGSLRLPSIALSLYCTLCALLSLQPVKGRVDFNCEFGSIITSIDAEGHEFQFCPTNMQPTAMPRGDFLVAFKDGACYECVCERGIGLACCECPRKRRRG